MVYKMSGKKPILLADKYDSRGAVKSKIMSNQTLVEELHKAIIRKFEKSKAHSSFIDNIWGGDLVDMQ